MMKIDDNRYAKINAFHGMDVIRILDQWVERQPDKTFVIWAPFEGEERRWSYAELAGYAKQFGAGLHDRGVRSGDFVLIHSDNSPYFLTAWFGCAYVGAVPVTINIRSVAENIKYFAEVMEPVYVITQPHFARMVQKACGKSTKMIITGEATNEDEMKGVDAEPFTSIFSDMPLPTLPPDPEKNFAVQFTSGTTSRPKPTVWTNANALWGGKSMSMNLRLRREDVTLINMPLFHANAQITLLTALWSGGTIVVHPRFSASRFWDACAKYGVTWISMIPFAFKALKGRPVPKHKVRLLVGLERLPDAEKEFGVKTLAFWGMTETVTACIITDADISGPAGTMGRPTPFYRVEVRKKDGTPAKPGEEGRLYIRGERGVTLFKEYYKHPEETQKAFDASGALDTGDLVRIDKEGWMYFINREKDMLRVGGENVAALEIEQAIFETGYVLECAVVAQKHYMLGDVPAAFISLTETGKGQKVEELKDRIVSHCRKQLADFKVPRSVHIVDDFPRSTLDRIAKSKLREQLPSIESD